ncbi:MAG: Tol biopolymer transport system component [Phycisphaerales bacterium]|jgi:Tol biopolymer transport system component
MVHSHTVDPQIGPYRIESELGRGGMGVVYRAVDSSLDRTVAIKALPAELASDPGRLERFEREAKTLAQLNHPNLAGIHGLERHSSQSGEATYLVLEFVEGETLADRLDRGPMEPDEAVELAIQIAAGVEAAHEAGVIHRDLKPANIMITPEGQAKVLDFGLAKADEGHSSTGSGMSQSPTMTSPAHGGGAQNSPTMPGVILGTAAYMSPEQARGRRVDKRSDIWSFGVILYEMLTGASPFVGETASDSIGAVLHKSFNFDRLPPETPGNVRRVLRRCLERDKGLRYRDIGDARIELQQRDSEVVSGATGAGGRSRGLAWAGWLVGAAALAGLAATVFRSNPAAVVPARFETDLIPRDGLELAQDIAPVRLSPDGTRLAYVGFSLADSASKVIVRDLRTGTETVLLGPDEPLSVSWEADSKHLVYLAGTRAERINVEGGRPEVLGEVGFNTGQSEVAPDGRLAYSGTQSPLAMLDPETRTTTDVIDPIPGRTGDWAVAPSFFPGGEHVLYFNQDDETADSGLYIASVATGESKRLLPFESTGRVVGQDKVLYSRDAFLFVQRIDLATLSLVGEPVQVAGPVYRKEWPHFAAFDATEDTLVYVTETLAGESMQFFEHDLATGEQTPLGDKGSLWSPSFSPDGTRIAFDRTVEATAGDIAVLDLETGVETMLSRDQSNESSPHWSRDGKWVYFFRGQDIYKVRSDGRSSPVLVFESDESKSPVAETPDGKSLVYNIRGTGRGIKALDLQTGETRAWLDTEAEEEGMGFLPGDEWFVYTSDISGEHRAYASLYDGEGVPVQLTDGIDPWVYIGSDRVYFAQARAIISLRVTAKEDGTLEVGEKETVMQGQGINDYPPMPDGTGLLLIRSIKPTRGGRMKVIQNWMPDEID